MFTLGFKPLAEREYGRLGGKIRERISQTLDRLRINPRPRGCVKLAGADELWRIRVGDYRIVYTIEDDQLLILVVRVANRKDVYRKDG